MVCVRVCFSSESLSEQGFSGYFPISRNDGFSCYETFYIILYYILELFESWRYRTRPYLYWQHISAADTYTAFTDHTRFFPCGRSFGKKWHAKQNYTHTLAGTKTNPKDQIIYFASTLSDFSMKLVVFLFGIWTAGWGLTAALSGILMLYPLTLVLPDMLGGLMFPQGSLGVALGALS